MVGRPLAFSVCDPQIIVDFLHYFAWLLVLQGVIFFISGAHSQPPSLLNSCVGLNGEIRISDGSPAGGQFDGAHVFVKSLVL